MVNSNMFPVKNMSDYETEMNRLFPRSFDNETLPPSVYHNASMHSPFQATNRSSSSADSISPESYRDMSFNYRVMYEQSIPPVYEASQNTGHYMSRRRPIVGRKILGSQVNQDLPLTSSPKTEEFAWQSDDSAVYLHTPPSTKNVIFDQKSTYELFPNEKPVKPRLSPLTPNYSPRSTTFSPTLSNFSPTTNYTPMPLSPSVSRQSHYLPQSLNYPSNMSNAGSSRQDQDATKMCTFCRKNGETPIVFMTHSVKEKIGNKHIVTCPILRSHVCSTCGASGDNAHTITYCPVLRTNNNGAPLRSTTITLKNTRIKSNGRRRF